MKKVSILIPCYNSEMFIAETLESCKRQTYKNWEVILVDDGSNDKSLEIANTFESEKIKVYSQPNLGACAARNYAFEKSTGEYIVFLDADDLINNEFIEKHIAALNAVDANNISFCSWGKFYKSIDETIFPKMEIYKDYSFGFELLLDMWFKGNMLQTTCYMIPRVLVEQSGGWDKKILKNQDGEFFSRILVLAKTAKYVFDAKVYYRTGKYMSVSRKQSEKTVSSVLYTLESYHKSVIAFEDSKRVRTALSIMFTSFIYTYGNLYPNLYRRAKQKIEDVGVGYVLKHEPRRVINICKIIGFDNFMRLRKFILKR